MEWENSSEIIVSAEPFDLWAGITVNNIAFFILEVPWDHNQNIPFTDPDLLFNLSFDPAHAGDPVKTPHPDMICTHHQLGAAKHLPVPFFGQPDADDLPGLILLFSKIGQYTISRKKFLVKDQVFSVCHKVKYIYSRNMAGNVLQSNLISIQTVYCEVLRSGKNRKKHARGGI
jgi:hypothetical protein